MSSIRELLAEAKRQRRAGMPLWRAIYSEGLVLAGMALRHRPLRWVWQARTAWLLYTRWNAPQGSEHRMTLRQDWCYAGSLAEMLDEAGEGVLWPRDAIDEDRQYWED